MKTIMQKFLLYCIFSSLMLAASTDFDTSFNTVGYNITSLVDQHENPINNGIAEQSNGYIITAGQIQLDGTTVETLTTSSNVSLFGMASYGILLTRYTPDGAVDTTFGNDGFITTFNQNSLNALSLAIYNDATNTDTNYAAHLDKFVIAGTSQSAEGTNLLVMRHHSDGTVDTLFGVNGIITIALNGAAVSSGNDIVIQSDGKIVVAGFADNQGFVVRYNVDGILDTTFNTVGYALVSGTGFAKTEITKILLHNDKIIGLANYSQGNNDASATGLLCLESDGTIDESFTQEYLSINSAYQENSIGLAVQTINSVDKFVLTGTLNSQMYVARFATTGVIDTTFGDINPANISVNLGYALFSVDAGTDLTATSLNVQQDNKIIIAGYISLNDIFNTIIVRYDTNGYLDLFFNRVGYITNTIPNYQIISRAAFLRTDTQLISAGQTVDSGGIVGSIISAYSIDQASITDLYQPFNYQGYNILSDVQKDIVGDENLFKIARQSTGKFVVVGNMAVNEISDIYLFRFNVDGSLDTTFGQNGYTTLIDLFKNLPANNYSPDTYPLWDSFSCAVAVDINDNIIVTGGLNYQYNEHEEVSESYGALIFKSLPDGSSFDGNFNTYGYIIEFPTRYDGDDQDLSISDARGYDVQFQSDNTFLVLTRYFKQYSFLEKGSDDVLNPTADMWHNYYSNIIVMVSYHADGSINKDFGDDGYKVYQKYDSVERDGSSSHDGTYDNQSATYDDLSGKCIQTQLNGNIVILVDKRKYHHEGEDPKSEDVITLNGMQVLIYGNDGQADLIEFPDTARAGALAVQSNNNIIAVANNNETEIWIAGVTSDGNINNSFGTNGYLSFDLDGAFIRATDIAILDNDQFVITGYTESEIIFIYFYSDGTLNTYVTQPVESLSTSDAVFFQADQKLLTSVGTSNSSSNISTSQFFLNLNSQEFSEFDTGFNYQGYNTYTNNGTSGSTSNAIGKQSTGNIVMAGQAGNSIILTRYTSDGQLDTSFGINGYTTTLINYESGAYDLAIDGHDNIVVAGYAVNNIGHYGMVLARYTSEGFLDTSFNSIGYIDQNYDSYTNNGAHALAIQSLDGKILVSSTLQKNIRVYRYNTDGSLDTTFNSSHGYREIDHDHQLLDKAVQLFSDGKIAVLYQLTDGSNISTWVYSYNTDGSNNNNFDDDAHKKFETGSNQSVPCDMVIQPDDKIVVTMTFGDNHTTNGQGVMTTYRCDKTGVLDTSFDGDGIANYSLGTGTYEYFTPTKIQLYDNGQILIVAYVTNISSGKQELFATRYNSDGSADIFFNKAKNHLFQEFDQAATAQDAILDTQASFVTTGQYNNESMLVNKFSYDEDDFLVLDQSFDTDGYNTFDYSILQLNSLKQQSDGKIITAGQANNSIIINRYNIDGSLDMTFGVNGSVTTNISGTLESGAYAVAIQANDAIVIVGYAVNSSGQYGTLVARYTADGLLDTGFNSVGYITTNYGVYRTNGAHATLVQPDSKILVSSTFEKNIYIYRFNSNGSLDTNFNGNGQKEIDNDNFLLDKSLKLLSDNKIAVLYQSTHDNNPSIFVSLFNTDGSYNGSFDSDGTRIFNISSYNKNVPVDIAIQPNNNIVIAGISYNGSSGNLAQLYLQRCTNTGALDLNFGIDGISLFALDTSVYTHLKPTNIQLYDDNKILVTGYVTEKSSGKQQAISIRYNSNGTLDTTFNSIGYIIQPIGKNTAIYDSLLRKYETTAMVGQYELSSMLINQFDNRTTSEAFITLDNTFSDLGYNHEFIAPYVGSQCVSNALGKQSTGKFVITGQANNGIIVTRYNLDGSLDNSFGINGSTATFIGSESAAYDLAIDGNDNIVVAGYAVNNIGYYGMVLARYTPEGFLDTSFNSIGYIDQNYDSYTNNGAHALAIQSDGKILVSSTLQKNIRVYRYNSDGSLDTTFNSSHGYREIDHDHQLLDKAVRLFSDGKIAVLYQLTDGSNISTWVYSYNTNGSSNNNFDDDAHKKFETGSNQSVPCDMVIQPDDKIIVTMIFGEDNTTTGQGVMTTYRCDKTGHMDTTFDTDGITNFGLDVNVYSYFTPKKMQLYDNGKIFTVGYVTEKSSGKQQVIAIRYNSNGSYDNTFNGTQNYLIQGFDEPATAQDAILDTQASFVTTGQYNNESMLINKFSYDEDDFLVLDPSFDTDGYNTFDYNYIQPHAVALQSDGKIVTAGQANGSCITNRYNVDGSLDTTFGTDGYTRTLIHKEAGIYAVAIDSDDNIVVAGYAVKNSGQYGMLVARYTPEGLLDTGFNETGYIDQNYDTYTTNGAHAVAIQSDDKILVASTLQQNIRLYRYNTNGSLDTTFNSSHGYQEIDHDHDLLDTSVQLFSDGKIAVLYQLTNGSSISTWVYSYNADGSRNNDFDDDGHQNYSPAGCNTFIPVDMVMQPNNKILCVGLIDTHNFFVLRINKDGSLDNTFGSGGYTYITVHDYDDLNVASINFDSEHNIIFVTGTVTIDSLEKAIIFKINYNGTLDSTLYKSGSVIQSFEYQGDVYNSNILDSTLNSDQDIILCGQYSLSQLLVARFIHSTRNNSEIAQFDYSFDDNGYNKETYAYITLETTCNAIGQQSTQRIISAGNTFTPQEVINLTSYNSDGTLHVQFGTNGVTVTSVGTSADARCLAIYNNSSNFDLAYRNYLDFIVIGGTTIIDNDSFALLCRYNADGFLDTTFGGAGVVTTQFGAAVTNIINDITIQSNGNLIGCGSADSNGFIARYSSLGDLDSTFNNMGYIIVNDSTYSSVNVVKTQLLPDNSIIALCNYSNSVTENAVGLIKVLENGIIDPSFTRSYISIDADSYTIGTDLMIQYDYDRYVILGDVQSDVPYIFIAGFDLHGNVDTTFGEVAGDSTLRTGYATITIDGGTDLTSSNVMLQFDSQMIITGTVLYDGQQGVVFVDSDQNGAVNPAATIENISSYQAVTNGSFIDPYTEKWVVAGQYDDHGIIISRYVGDSQTITASSTTSNNQVTSARYGQNQAAIESFLPVSFYAQKIPSAVSRSASIVTVNDTLREYILEHLNTTGFNFVRNLYILKPRLEKVQARLIQRFPLLTDDINVFFRKVFNRIDKLQTIQYQ